MTHGPMGPRPPAPPPPGLVGPYPGLLYTEGRDTLGRPVVVLNTAMLPAKAKKEQVLEYVLGALQPLVQQVRAAGGLPPSLVWGRRVMLVPDTSGLRAAPHAHLAHPKVAA